MKTPWRDFLASFRKQPARSVSTATRCTSYCPWVECLENRLVLAAHDTLGTAVPLVFDANQQAQYANSLADPNQVDLYAITLAASDQVVVDVTSQTLNSPAICLRIFDNAGQQVAFQPNTGGFQVSTTFEVPATGTYYVGVSSTNNFSYDPNSSGTGSGGLTTGPYDLHLSRTSLLFLSQLSSLPPQPVGRSPRSVAVGDFDHNGKVDLVTANSSDDTVSVLLGRGDGTFLPPVSYKVGTGPYAVAVGDFNNDNNLDIVTANAFDGTVSVLLGSGDGTFLPALSYELTGSPFALAVGDFNRDGNLDLVTANALDGTVSVLLGSGNGAFLPLISFNVGRIPSSVAVGDFNGDGNLDIVTGNLQDGTVSVFLGRGDGSFLTAASYPVGSGPSSIAVGDFNHDGHLDIVTADSPNNTALVLLGRGDGTFQPAISYLVGLGPISVTGGDLNNDGNLDIVTANIGDNTASVLLGRGDGNLPRNGFVFDTQVLAYALGAILLVNNHFQVFSSTDFGLNILVNSTTQIISRTVVRSPSGGGAGISVAPAEIGRASCRERV